jgi:hypothetical protein
VNEAIADGAACGPCGAVCAAGVCQVSGGCASDGDCPQPGSMCGYAWCDVASCTCKFGQDPNCGGCDVTCDDGNPCTVDSCDPATGACSSVPGGNGQSCGPCGAMCANGYCAGPPVVSGCSADTDCDDGDPCTKDVCVDGCVCQSVALPTCGACADCDDGNPCTADQCDPQGACHSVPLDGKPCDACGVCSAGQCLSGGAVGCLTDSDCADNDPCTTEVCDGCTCQVSVISGCGGPCQDDAQCDDGDPCTKDACVAGHCERVADGGCAPPPLCNSQGVKPLSDILWGATGVPVKIAGAPQAANAYTCTAAVCDPVTDPCCNTCMGDLQLVDMGWGIVSTPMNDLEPAWACSSDNCGVTQSCAPPQLGTGYWVWGTTYGAVGGVPFIVAEPAARLGVQGWCVQTTPAGLPGVWEGPVTLMDTMLGITVSYEVRVTISYGVSGWSFWVEPATVCESCAPNLPPQLAQNIVVGDGDVSFSVSVTTAQGPVVIGVYLTSWHNTLSGQVGTLLTAVPGGGAPFVPMPAGPTGTLSLTKVPPGAPGGTGTMPGEGGGSGGGAP